MRRPDWRKRLAAFISTRRDTPHVWGASDCALTAADAVEAETGIDYAAPLRGYRCELGAARALVRAGHRSIVSYLDTILPRATRATAGDFVVEPAAPLDRVGVADGRGFCWTQGPRGIVRTAIPENALVWRV